MLRDPTRYALADSHADVADLHFMRELRCAQDDFPGGFIQQVCQACIAARYRDNKFDEFSQHPFKGPPGTDDSADSVKQDELRVITEITIVCRLIDIHAALHGKLPSKQGFRKPPLISGFFVERCRATFLKATSLVADRALAYKAEVLTERSLRRLEAGAMETCCISRELHDLSYQLTMWQQHCIATAGGRSMTTLGSLSNRRLALAVASLMLTPGLAVAQIKRFQIEEASIASIQSAIKSGQTTCRAVVQAYIDRAKAYNGACTALITADGAPVPAATGAVRTGSKTMFPTATVPVTSLFPNYSEYAGLPLELGRMEPTKSDSSVQQQVGMRVGIPNAGQLNALETINIRGERSVTCKGDFDKAPSAGPLPPGAPSVCEEFRKLPDALERAAELDKQYGSKPDLAKLPMYCVAFSLKNWYDAKDIRGTGGNDTDFAMDVPKFDSPDVARPALEGRDHLRHSHRRQCRRSRRIRGGQGENHDAFRESQVWTVGRSGL